MLNFFSLTNVLRSGIVVCLCLSLTGLFSCSDDDAPDDNTAPAVSFSGLADNDAVWNTVKAVFNVSDDVALDKLEVYIDGTLFTTLDITGETPLDINWDSNTVSDGSHVIKAVVTDKSGKSATAQVTVIVKNMLISFDIADDHLVGDEIGIVILSDEAGNVIASTQYQNGDHFELRSSTFTGEKFVLTECLLGSEDQYPVMLWTYPLVERGTWSVYHELSEMEEVADANLTFSNAVLDASYRIATNGNSFLPSIENTTFSTSGRLIKSPSKLYVAKLNNNESIPNTYRLFPSVTSGANATINLNQVDQLMTKTTIDLPQGASYLEHYLEGYAVAGDVTERFRLGQVSTESASSLTIEHPGNAFPVYYGETLYTTDEFYFESGSTPTLYNTTALQYDATFSIADGKLNCSSSGNYDFISTSFWNDETTRWVFYLPKGSNQSVAIPDLSDAVTTLLSDTYPGVDFEEFLPNLTVSPTSYFVVEYEAIDGYDGLKNYIRTATRGYSALLALPNNFTSMEIKDNSGGRVASQKKAARRKW
jgi:hypothetical protein